MLGKLLKSKISYLIFLIYFVVFSWWIFLQIHGVGTEAAYYFNSFYGVIALFGAFYGFYVSKKYWGGWHSLIGRALICLSLGLLSQWIGLMIWCYFNIIAKVEAPYPSVADVGYFGLVPFYTYAAYLLSKASGVKFTLKSLEGKIMLLLIPLIALGVSYFLFLKNIGFDLANPLKTFFDIAYPLGEIIPVSIALTTFVLSRKILSGTMRKRIFYLIFAFSFQFLTEYLFLYVTGINLLVNGGITDIFYASSYAIMFLGLVYFSSYD